MEFAAQALEVVLLVSALAHLALAIAVTLYRDGRIWTIFQIDVVLSFISASAGYIGIHAGVFHPEMRNFTLTALAIGLLGISRLGGAVTKMVLAIHLRRLARNGVPPLRPPLELHRTDSEGTAA